MCLTGRNAHKAGGRTFTASSSEKSSGTRRVPMSDRPSGGFPLTTFASKNKKKRSSCMYA